MSMNSVVQFCQFGSLTVTMAFKVCKLCYTQKPEERPELVKMFAEARPVIAEKLGDDDIPLIWTADFMLADDDETGEDTYVPAGL